MKRDLNNETARSKKWNFFHLLAYTLIFLASSQIYAQPISSELVGTNVWHKPADWVWDSTAAGGFQTIRIGGAAYDHHLPDFEQLLTWVKQIRAAGAEPVVQYSKYYSADSAALLVNFLNKKHGMNVTYWGIGNEPWLQLKRPAQKVAAAKIEEYWKPRAAAMKEADPTIKIFGPNCCDYLDTIYTELFGGANYITGKVPGKNYYYCDGLTFHRYPQGNGNPGTEGADDIIKRIVKAKAKVDEVNKARPEGEKLQWGIGEFNAKSGALVHTWGNGQMFGQVLGACMKYEATFATTWSMFEHGGIRKETDFSMIDSSHIPRASFRHAEFIAKYFKGIYVDGASSSEQIKIFGALNGDTVSVMILNREGAGSNYCLKLNSEKTATHGVLFNLDINKNISYCDTIAAQSTQVLIFKGKELTKWVYTSNDFEKNRAPVKKKILLE